MNALIIYFCDCQLNCVHSTSNFYTLAVLFIYLVHLSQIYLLSFYSISVFQSYLYFYLALFFLSLCIAFFRSKFTAQSWSIIISLLVFPSSSPSSTCSYLFNFCFFPYNRIYSILMSFQVNFSVIEFDFQLQLDIL